MPSIQLLIPIFAYRRLMADCPADAPEHQLLTEGILEFDSSGLQRVRVFCDKARVNQIFGFIRRVHPELLIVITQLF